MPGPAQPRNALRASRRATGVAFAVTLVFALACGCGHAAPPRADAASDGRIDINTPPAVHAQQVMDMLNSDWPIGPVGIGTLAAPDKVDDVGTTMERMWWDRPFTRTGVDIGATQATLRVRTSYGVDQVIELRTDKKGYVERFDVTLAPPQIKTWSDIDRELTKSGARYAYQAAKVTDGKCLPVAGSNTDLNLPLASIFKLYVLLAVSHAITAGTLDWNDQLEITAEAKAVGSATLDALKPGSHVSVRTAAQQMISASDNMATDLLIDRLGPGAVDQALALAGHHDPASMTPFPTAHELFSIGWGNPDVREQWQHASPQARAVMLAETKTRPYEPDPWRSHTPASPYGAEWYGTAGDICRVHAALQASAVGRAAPVKDILSKVAGIDLDMSKWAYIGAKGGNLPADITFSWYAVDRTGQGWVVNFQLNWPKFRSLTAATWLLSIAKGAFAMIQDGNYPVDRSVQAPPR